MINRQMDFLEIFELALTLLGFMRNGNEQIHHCRFQQNLLNVFAVSGFNFFLALAFVFGKLFIASGQLLTREN